MTVITPLALHKAKITGGGGGVTHALPSHTSAGSYVTLSCAAAGVQVKDTSQAVPLVIDLDPKVSGEGEKLQLGLEYVGVSVHPETMTFVDDQFNVESGLPGQVVSAEATLMLLVVKKTVNKNM